MTPSLLSVADALSCVLSQVRAKTPAHVPIDKALGRTLAADVASDVDSPPHDKSIVDGYAVRIADLASGAAELEILEEVTAGALPTQHVRHGQATRVMTGAPVPPGAEAVVMVERATVAPRIGWPLGAVTLKDSPPKIGQNIVPRAASMRRGDVILKAGCEIRPIETGLLAEVGRCHVRVAPRAVVAVLATGNELVPCEAIPAPGQIRNSNGPLLAAAVWQAGGVPVELGIARDDKDDLRRMISRGLASDVLVLSGGVSAGVLDLVPEALAELGVQPLFHKVRLKPGKPLWFGTWPNKPAGESPTLVFGLPGNPVSSLVCFELFVRPAIAKLSGRGDDGSRQVSAVLAGEFNHRGDRPTYHPAKLAPQGADWSVVTLPWQGSGDLRTLAAANAFAIFPAGDCKYAAGARIEALRL